MNDTERSIAIKELYNKINEIVVPFTNNLHKYHRLEMSKDKNKFSIFKTEDISTTFEKISLVSYTIQFKDSKLNEITSITVNSNSDDTYEGKLVDTLNVLHASVNIAMIECKTKDTISKYL